MAAMLTKKATKNIAACTHIDWGKALIEQYFCLNLKGISLLHKKKMESSFVLSYEKKISFQ